MDRPKGIHKRARTTSTELYDEDEPEEDPFTMQRLEPPINWHELILKNNTSTSPKEERIITSDQIIVEKSASFSSAESTTLSEDEMSSLHSLIEQTEGFESGFETFDDFLSFSNSNLEEDEEQIIHEKVKTKTKSKLKRKLKRKLKKLKTKLKTSCQVKKQLKSIQRNSGPILRAISNATALVFRGALFLTVNVMVVLTVILSLAII